MSDTLFNLDILTPTTHYDVKKVKEVKVITDNGEITILSHHEEYLGNVEISLLVVVTEHNASEYYAVNGGVVHFDNEANTCKLMLNKIYNAKDIDLEKVKQQKEDALNKLKSNLTNYEHKEAERSLRKALNKQLIKDLYGKQ